MGPLLPWVYKLMGKRHRSIMMQGDSVGIRRAMIRKLHSIMGAHGQR